MKTRIIACAAIASVIAAPAAFADDKFELTFDFSPVEASTEIGAEKIYEELEAMIEEKCEPIDIREKLRHRAETEECVTQTLDKAVAKLDKPQVAAVHQARRG